MNVKTTQIILGRLRSFLTSKTTLLALLLVFAVAGNAQYGPNDDFDGDGVINADDLDDDNDGIYDTEENKGSVPLLSGFEPLFPATLPPDPNVPSDDAGSPALVLPSPSTGSRVIVRNALTYGGVSYHAIVEVTGVGNMGSGTVGITMPAKNLALMHIIPTNNAYFTYSLKFVSSVGFVAANYQNNTPIVGAIIPNVTVVLADIDGSSNYAEISGYKNPTGPDTTINQLPFAGSNLVHVTSAISPTFGGFQWGTANQGGPGATAFNYYRPSVATATNGGSNIDQNLQANWVTIKYDSFKEGEYVFGNSGKGTSERGEGGPSMFMSNIDYTDIDGDGKDNSFDLDSDGDGCSDSNEYYVDPTYAGPDQEFQQTGGAKAPVYPNGTVIAAAYPNGADYTLVATPTRISVTPNGNPIDVKIDPGNNAVFSAIVEGVTANAIYTWEQRINSTAAWTPVSNGGIYSGAGTTALTITNVPSSMSNYEYRIIILDDPLLGNGGNYVCGSLTSTVAKITFNNLLPVAKDDILPAVDEDSTVGTSINVVTNAAGQDTDADGTVDATTVDLDPLTAGKQFEFTVIGQGKFTVVETGANAGLVTFIPALNFNGTSSIDYTVNDNLGVSSLPGKISIIVNPINDVPVAQPDSVTVQEDVLFTSTVSLLANDTDIDLDPLTAVAGTFTTAKGGTLILAANGSYTYLSALNFNGADTVNYTVTDGKSPVVGILNITVDSVNDAPIANDDTANITKDTDVIISVASNDTDIDGTINVTTIDLDPLNVGIQTTFTVAGEGTYTANANGTVTFDPEANFDGIATPVSYVIQDNQGAVSVIPATITVTVNADSDGDGVLDATEIIDGTDPLDPCSSIPANATLPKTADFSACEIEILTSFSPNGDGSNEEFKIRNIEKYPNNTLQVYDRWGVVVYEANGYGQGDKLFRGQSQGRSTVSASGQLPVGTYFYALKYVDASGNGKERSGYLYINR